MLKDFRRTTFQDNPGIIKLEWLDFSYAMLITSDYLSPGLPVRYAYTYPTDATVKIH